MKIDGWQFMFTANEIRDKFADKLVLLLWNQFSLRKIVALRVSLLIWLGCIVFTALESFWGRSVIIPLCALGLLYIWKTDTRASKASIAAQNGYAILIRNLKTLVMIRFVSGLFFIFLLVISVTGKHALINILGVSMWILHSSLEVALQSEEPPKRWKFSLKLPSFNLFPPPVPQGA